MSAVGDARKALNAALDGVPGIGVFQLGEAAPAGPGAVVYPPVFHFESFDPAPTGATFTVAVTVPADDLAFDRLAELVPLVKDALQTTPGSVEPDVTPAGYSDGGPLLPSYEFTVNYPL